MFSSNRMIRMQVLKLVFQLLTTSHGPTPDGAPPVLLRLPAVDMPVQQFEVDALGVPCTRKRVYGTAQWT